MRSGLLIHSLTIVTVLTGCEANPGRAPLFPDAAVPMDALPPEDTGPPDRGMRDAGFFDGPSILPDASPLPEFQFTGVWGLRGQSASLFTREVDDTLSIIVGNAPYLYVGTIADNGDVEVTSPVLLRSGCPTAQLTGNYDRAAAFFTLRHESCGVDGTPFTADLSGGFASDYQPDLSGVYALDATVVMVSGPCAPEPGVYPVQYGISFEPTSQTVAVFTGVDIAETQQIYLGRYNTTNGEFSITAQAFVQPGGLDTRLTGRFEVDTAGAIPRFFGQRDVLDPETNCAFRMTLMGSRIEVP